MRKYLIALLIITHCLFSERALAQTVNASPNDTLICEGESVRLNAVPSFAGLYNYTWFPSADLSDASIANPLATPSVTTRYYVILSDLIGNFLSIDTVTIEVVNNVSVAAAASDSTVCIGTNILLNAIVTPANCNNYRVEAIPHQMLNVAPRIPVNINNSGDSYDVLGYDIPIGFNFDFFCNTYSTIEISSEGYLTFDFPGNTNDPNPQTLADPNNPNNLIAMAWADLSPTSGGGVVDYATFGAAPYRIFIVNFENVRHQSSLFTVSGQVRLYETSNVIEIHIEDQFELVNHTMGIENAGGTIGFAPPGRNNVPWVANNESWRFIPDQPIRSTEWFPTTGLSDSSILNPTALISDSINYTVFINRATCPVSDSVEILADSCFTLNATVGNSGATDTLICEAQPVQLNVTASTSGPFTYSWTPVAGLSDPNIANPIANPLVTTDYIVEVNKGIVTVYDTVTVNVNPAIPPIAMAVSDSIVCTGDLVQLNAFVVPPAFNYTWSPSLTLNDPNIDNPTAIVAVSTNYTVIVDDGICYDSASIAVYADTCPVISIQDTILCTGQSTELDLQVSPAGSYTYSWTPAATLSNPNIRNPVASPATTTLYTVGVTTALETYYHTVLVTVIDTSTIYLTTSDSLVCEGNTVQLNVNYPVITNEDYIVQSIPYNPLNGIGNSVSLNNEEMSPGLPIGFNFDFFSNSYNTFYLSSNGFLTFSNLQPPTPEEQSVPTPGGPNNLIAFSWTDLDPSFGSPDVEFYTIGSAPDRQLVVNYSNVFWFGTGTRVTVQLILKETSNIIEVHTLSQNFAGEEVTVGIENSTGTIGFAPPGRNDTPFNVVAGESWQFIPNQVPTWSFDWDPGTVMSDSTIVNPFALIAGASTVTLNVTVSNNSCDVDRSIDVDVIQPFADITVTPDTSICRGDSVQLNTVIDTLPGDTLLLCNDYDVSVIPFSPVLAGGVAIALGQDGMSPAIPLAFNFEFYCQEYNQVFISSNGFMTFTGGQPGLCCGAPNFSSAVPNAVLPNNLIALFWADLDPTLGGSIEFGTNGLAPNRRFFINFRNIQHQIANPVGPGPDDLSGQIILYEGSNEIEIHVLSQPIYQYTVPPIADYFHTMGIENANGTLGHFLGGYNDTAWTANNFAVRFSPRRVPNPAPTSFTWNPTAFMSDTTILNPSVFPLTTTNYILEMTKSGCTVYDTVAITVYDSIAINDSIILVSCNGSNDGEAHANVTGGVRPYSYLWSTGATDSFIVNLNPGVFTVTVTDAVNCSAVNVSVIVARDSIIFDTTITDAYCGVLGSIDLIPGGATPPYSYIWSTGATTEDVNNLPVGNYRVTVTDFNGCPDSIELSVGLQLPFTIDTNLTIISCLGSSDGDIDITVNGGIPPFSYNWSSGDTTEDLIGFTTGVYTVTVTDSAGCADSISVYLGEVPVCCIDIDLNPWNQESDVSQGTWILTANGDSVWQDFNGEPTFFVSPDSFINTTINGYFMVDAAAWDNDYIGFVFGYQSPYAANGDPVDDYEFLIFDWKRQDQNWTYLGQEGFALSAVNGTFNDAINDFRRHFWGHVDQPPKFDVLDTQFGAGLGWVPGVPYQFTLQYDTNRIRIFIDGTLIFDVAGTFQPGGFGFYNYSQEDVLYWGFSQPLFPYLEDTTHITCPGGSDGEVIVSASGGRPPYTWMWTNNLNTDTLYGDTVSGLYSAIWTGRLVDAVGCDVSYVVNLREPILPNILTDSIDVLCSGGSDGYAIAQATRNLEPFTYLWQGGQTNDTITGISAGLYHVTITDSSGCPYYDSVQVNEPTALALVMGQYNPVCFYVDDGYAAATPSGGVSPYSYLWSNGGTTDTIFSLAPGSYVVTVTDANLCQIVDSVLLPVPPFYTMDLDSQDVSCFGFSDGFAFINSTSNPNGPFTYLWDAAAGSQTNDTAFNLINGQYILSVTDTLGCLMVDSVIVNQPTDLTINFFSRNVDCNGSATGFASVSLSGATSPYSFLWSNGVTNDSIVNVAAGNYILSVTDANGCLFVDSVLITEPPLLTHTKDSVNILCFGDSTGMAYVTASGGTLPYSYVWSTASVNDTILNLFAGQYFVTITDDSGCINIDSFNIEENALIVPVMDSVSVSCFSNIDGLGIVQSISGGVMPFSYLWSDLQTSDTAFNLAPGVYSVVVTDSVGCTATDSITISEPPQITIDIDTVSISCFGGNDGQLAATAGNSIHTPFAYSWNTGDTTPVTDSLTVGWYSVVVSDTNGCTMLQLINLTQPTDIVLAVTQSPVSCFSYPDGSADLTPSGGTPPYSYLWSNGSSTEDITSVAAGLYSVTVTDSLGCSDSISITITQPAPLMPIAAITPSSCSTVSDGAIDVTISGGTPPFSYIWSDGSTVEDLIGYSSGTYVLTVTDFNACVTNQAYSIYNDQELSLSSVLTFPECDSANGEINIEIDGGSGTYSYIWSTGSTVQDLSGLLSDVYSVTVSDVITGCTEIDSFDLINSGTLTINAVINNASSCGASDGFIVASAAGGSGGYTFNWSHGQSGSIATNLSAGAYSVTVRDIVTGCSAVRTINIFENNSLNVTSIVNDATCGVNDGSINVTISGGSGSYTYQWSNGSSTQDIAAIPSGFYMITITDNITTCSVIETFSVSENGGPALTATSTDLSCPSFNDGSIDLTVAGMPGPFYYSWSTGDTSEDISGLAIGSYTVNVIDSASLCQSILSIDILSPAEIQVTLNPVMISCFGDSSGSIDLEVSGGTTPYTYAWNGGATSQDTANLPFGLYSVAVTDSNGCIVNGSVNINQPQDILLDTAMVMVTCFGGSDGSIDLTITGGIQPYSFSWSTGAATEDISNLSAGTYSVTVTDLNGCVDSIIQINISQPTQMVLDTALTQVTCNSGNNGAIDLSVSGGTAPYTFNWSTGATTEDISALTAGTYSVTVFDASGCSDSLTLLISEPSAIITDSFSIINVLCFGGSDGSATIHVSGGTPPYSYNWSNGSAVDSINNVIAGTYSVIVTDSFGCIYTDSVVIAEPTVLTLSSVNTDIDCYGDSTGVIDLTISGGISPYTVLWSDGSVTQDINTLQAGNYSVTVTDNNLCVDSLAATLNQSSLLTVTENLTHPACADSSTGIIDLTPSGGVPPYTVVWSDGSTGQDLINAPAGLYTYILSDNLSCSLNGNASLIDGTTLNISVNVANSQCSVADGAIDLLIQGGSGNYSYIWSNGATTQDVSNLAVGTYSVTVTDNILLCQASEVIQVNSNSPLILNGIINNANTCGGSNGFILLGVAGGSGSYSYIWSNGATTSLNLNLSAGDYTVTATDNVSFCQAIATYTVGENNTLNLTPTITDASCGISDGAINLSVSSGSGSYSYQWSNGSTLQNISALYAGLYMVTVTDNISSCAAIEQFILNNTGGPVLSTNVIDKTCPTLNNGSIDLSVAAGSGPYTYSWSNGDTTEDILNLDDGIYSVIVIDSSGQCQSTIADTVSSPDPISFTIDITQILCSGANDGAIDLTISGGTPPYLHLWSGGATSEDTSGLAPGAYTILVTDVNSCQDNSIVNVTEPPAIAFDTVVTVVTCFGGNDGSIDLIVSGGVGPYSYLWSNGSSTEDINTLVTGSYSVTVTDANGCVDSLVNVVVGTTPQISFDTTIIDVTCYNGTDGNVDLIVSGGTAPYSFAWSNSNATEDLFSISAGFYSVTVTDLNGCVDSLINILVSEPPQYTVDSFTVSGVSCNGGNDGQIIAHVSGGTPPYTYAWSDGQTNDTAVNLSPITYTLIVVDANICPLFDTVTIADPPLLVLNSSVTNVSCNLYSDGMIDLSPVGGSLPYTFNWSNGASTEDISGLTNGNYTVTVTDGNGCIDSLTLLVSEPNALLLTAVITDETCAGSTNGAINLTTGGGTFPYSYIWSNGTMAEDLSNINSGLYEVTATDVNGCLATGVYSVSTTNDLILSYGIASATCGQQDGSIDLTVSNGSGNYVYSWSTGDSTQDIFGIGSGSYYLTVIDTSFGCSVIDSSVVVPANGISVAGLITDASTCSSSDGIIVVGVSGGSLPYSITWSTGQSGSVISNLSPGIYSVSVVDNNGCLASESFMVNATNTLNVTAIVNDASCNSTDGSIDLTVAGGSGLYSFNWSNGSSTEDINSLAAGPYSVTVSDLINGCSTIEFFAVNNTLGPVLNFSVNDVVCFGQANGAIDLTVAGGSGSYLYNWSNGRTTEDIGFIPAGDYFVQVIDQVSGCISSDSVSVNSPENIGLQFNLNHVSCLGSSDGTIDMTVSGGTAPYQYFWSNGSISEDLNSLSGGTYSILIQDSNLCSFSSDVVINEPNLLVLDTSVVHINCFGYSDGQIDLIVSGGTTPYTYLWSNGSTNEDLVNLNSGSYTITVIDNNGCTDSIENIFISEPLQLLLDTNVTRVTCAGANTGGIDLLVSGGVGPYTFLWSNGFTSEDLNFIPAGTYSTTVTDANGCVDSLTNIIVTEPVLLVIDSVNSTDVFCSGGTDGTAVVYASGGTPPYLYSWSNGQTNDTAINLPAGMHYISVLDNNGCNANDSVQVNEPVTILTVAVQHVNCYGFATGAIDITYTGGVLPYSYIWNTGDTTEDISALNAGNYSLTISDANGCQEITNMVVNEPALININGVITPANCASVSNGNVDITVTGGVTPYNFAWNDGSTSEDLIGATPGLYTIVVSDSNGCLAVESYSITVDSNFQIAYAVRTATCGENDGGVNLSISGGSGSYGYNWSNGTVLQNLDSVTAGVYYVTITDLVTGCNRVEDFIINDNNGISLSEVITDVSSCAGSDGSILLNVAGGSGSYLYNWSTGGTSSTIVNLISGVYNVTVTDSISNCSVAGSYFVDENSNLNLTYNLISPLCGQNNASVNLSVSGGSGSYSYQWSNGATSEDISGIPAGIYTVDVLDIINGCSDQEIVVISDSSNLILSSVISDPSCPGGSNGSINLAVGGGSGVYSYNWSNGQTVQNIGLLTEGIYTVIVYDQLSNCEAILVDTLSDPAALNLLADVVNNSCFGESLGSIDLTVSGGVTPYTFLWSHGPTAEDALNLPAGLFSVNVLDANNCLLSTDISVSQPTNIVLDTTLVHNLCAGDSLASIDLLVSGGSPPFNYLWSNGQTSEDIDSLAAGSYSVTVSDDKGCIDSLLLVIVEPGILVLDTVITDVSCFGNSNGYIDLTVSGGVMPYSYLWSNGSTTEDIGLLFAGYYNISVTDANNCSMNIDSIRVTEPAVLNIDSIIVTDVSCAGGSNGFATAIASGGTQPYTFNWGGPVGDTVFNLSAGAYSLLLVDTLGCTDLENFTVSEPSGINTSVSRTNVTCYSGNDGIAIVSSTGGIPPYTYNWSNGQANDTIDSLQAGWYFVSVYDANNCLAVDSIEITQPDSITINLAVNNIQCFGDSTGSILAIVAGGTPPYTYQWADGQTSSNLINLPAGFYTLSITDSRSCPLDSPAIASVNVIQPPLISIDFDSVDILCPGASTGIANAIVTGGTGSYTYLWSNGQTSDTSFNLPAGSHSVVVTDSLGCSNSDTVTINEPNPLSSGLSIQNISCFGSGDGSIWVIPSGGTPGYNISWSTGSTLDTINNLSPGLYYVTITDSNNCQFIDSSQISNPVPVMVSVNTIDLACFNDSTGMAIPVISGGSSPYTYNWSTGVTADTLSGLSIGSYDVTAVDNSGCVDSFSFIINQPSQVIATASVVSNYNGYSISYFGGNDGSALAIPGGGTPGYTYLWDAAAGSQTSPLADSLSAGTYTVSVFDANGCIDTALVTLTQPPLITVTTAITSFYNGWDISCYQASDGSVNVTTSGGVPPYTYQWDSAAGAGTDTFALNLSSGTYFVTVTDANGGTAIASIFVNEPPRLLANAAINSNYSGYSTSCFGSTDGIASAVPGGGTAPYNYAWSNGQFTNIIGSLGAGSYFVSVTDVNNCMVIDTVNLTEPPPLSMVIDSSQVITCNAGNDGSASVTPVGGVGPFAYLWSDGQTDSMATNLVAGGYSVTVWDNNGCQATGTLTVNEPLTLSISVDSMGVVCAGSATGSASAIASGGTPGYQYLWSNGDADSIAQNVTGGTYIITVTDNNGCTASEDVIVNEPSPFVINQTVNDASCFGFSDGSATLIASGGVLPYSFIWPTSNTTPSESNLAAGTYNVTVIDANNCIVIEPVQINEPSQIVIQMDTTNISCFGADDGIILTSISGGSGGYSFVWSNGSNNLFQPGLGPGSYSITVTDVNGCIDSSTTVMNEPAPLIIDMLGIDPTCFGGNNGYAVASGVGGSFPYTYLWSNGSTGAANTDLSANNYQVTVTDNNGCSIVSGITLNDPPPIEIYVPGGQIEIDLGESVLLDIEHNIGHDSVTYQWSPAYGLTCTDCQDPLATPYHNIEYTVTVTNIADPDYTCSSEAIIEIIVIEDLDLFIPNAFTPNADGENDVFSLYSDGIAAIRIQIFNRIGEMVFESQGINTAWDGMYKGEMQQPGVYVYNAEILFINGKTVKRNGTVTLLR